MPTGVPNIRNNDSPTRTPPTEPRRARRPPCHNRKTPRSSRASGRLSSTESTKNLPTLSMTCLLRGMHRHGRPWFLQFYQFVACLSLIRGIGGKKNETARGDLGPRELKAHALNWTFAPRPNKGAPRRSFVCDGGLRSLTAGCPSGRRRRSLRPPNPPFVCGSGIVSVELGEYARNSIDLHAIPSVQGVWGGAAVGAVLFGPWAKKE